MRYLNKGTSLVVKIAYVFLQEFFIRCNGKKLFGSCCERNRQPRTVLSQLFITLRLLCNHNNFSDGSLGYHIKKTPAPEKQGKAEPRIIISRLLYVLTDFICSVD